MELNYHPNNYKRRFCIYFPDNLHKCKFGEYCSYAHSESDILVELLHNYEFDSDFFMFHYKTSFCPINHIDHDRSLCVYAHNWQDYRRKFSKHNTEPEICPEWNNTKNVLNYEEGGSRGFDCNYCHGWKEPEYHPFVYKTKKCESSEEECARLNACPYYHNEDEKREISENDKIFFQFVPACRVTQGTFKVFKDTKMYGLTKHNKYQQAKNDEKRFESIRMSMSSINLLPSNKGPRSMPSISFMKSKNNLNPNSPRKNSGEKPKNKKSWKAKSNAGKGTGSMIAKLGMLDEESEDSDEEDDSQSQESK